MHTARIVFTVIMALILMGCPPPVSDNPGDSASGSSNPNAPASAGSNLQPKAIVVDQVSAGDFHTMILKSDDTLWAVGQNTVGQLGNDDVKLATRKTPEQVMTKVDYVSAGGAHSMILKNDDTLWAVGKNDFGQLGDKSNDNTVVPKKVMTEVDQVSAGRDHTVILKKNGELWAVGRNHKGQLGDGTTNTTSTPVKVKDAPPGDGGDVAQPITNVARISAGAEHSMILKKNGELWAVGSNSVGQLGDGTTTNSLTPVQVMEKPPGDDPVQPMTNVDQVSAGGLHTMILKKNNTLWGTGSNLYGQLGNNSYTNLHNPEQILDGVAQVSAGGVHTMIVKKGDTLWAVGKNDNGQLGNGTLTESSTPVEVRTAPAPAGRPMTAVAQVSVGKDHSMILKTNGTLWAVGSNWHGQLGNGKSGFDVKEVTPVQIMESVGGGGNNG